MRITSGTWALLGIGGGIAFAASTAASGASSRRKVQRAQQTGNDPFTTVQLGSAILGVAMLVGSVAVKRPMAGVTRRLGMGVLAGTAGAGLLHRLFANPAVAAINGTVPSVYKNRPAHVPSTPPPGADPRTGTVRAIDISGWQPNVDWHAVHDAGVGYAFIKASEGKTFVDPTFREKRMQATAAGVRIGAYDFARPGSKSSDVIADATAEARHFLRTAQIRSGDLAPVLDLEDPNQKLNPNDLALWVDTWLTTVEQATGVKPLVYTSPSYWNEHVNDTRGISQRFPLWLAHWDTKSPRNPKGWQSWQAWQSGVTTIPGIPGKVDEDWIKEPERLIVP